MLGEHIISYSLAIEVVIGIINELVCGAVEIVKTFSHLPKT